MTVRGQVDRREDTLRFTAMEMSMPDISMGPTGPLVISLPIAQCTPQSSIELKRFYVRIQEARSSSSTQ